MGFSLQNMTEPTKCNLNLSFFKIVLNISISKDLEIEIVRTIICKHFAQSVQNFDRVVNAYTNIQVTPFCDV